MNRKGDKSLIVGLDIGTSKVVALVGEYSPGNPIEVIGIGFEELCWRILEGTIPEQAAPAGAADDDGGAAA
jgi:cell division ATPase FtsA